MAANKKGSRSASKKAAQTRANNQKHKTAKKQAIAISYIFIGVICMLAVIFGKSATGVVGAGVKNVFFGLFGLCAYVVPVLFIYIGVLLAIRKENAPIKAKIIWACIFVLCAGVCINVFYHSNTLPSNLWELTKTLYADGVLYKNGGVLGGLVGELLIMLFGKIGTAILLGFVLFVSVIFISGVTLAQIYRFFFPKKEKSARPAEKASVITGEKARDVNIDIPVDDVFEKRKPDVEKIVNTLTSGAQDSNQLSLEQSTTEQQTLSEKELEEIKNHLSPAKEQKEEENKDESEFTESEIIETDQNENYIFPDIDLLVADTKKQLTSKAQLEAKGKKLIEVLKSFGVEATISDVCVGPAATRFELSPKAGTKVAKFTSLADDLALGLAARSVRIEAPIPGKAAVGIEVPNDVVGSIRLRSMLASKEFKNSASKLTVSLGKNITGDCITADIAKMPHVLIAGTTGSGKSVCTNSFIMSILYKATPDQVKMILIDPKIVEFGNYAGIPHLLVPVVTDPKKAAGALNWAVVEMMRRYKLFSEVGAQNLASYNDYNSKDEAFEPICQLVIIIDEFADLMMVASTEVEDAVCRIAQMGRAAGIHLVIATQRPSADVITGIIKANIPTRIALTVASALESRIILGTSGADKLLGRGDMLYLPQGMTKPVRIQGCYVDEAEIRSVVSFVKTQGQANYDEKVIESIEKTATEDTAKQSGDQQASDEDPMLLPAIEVVVEMQQASTSLLQRKLKLGYSRAARIIDQMEEMGIVGEYEGSKPRKVKMTKMQYQEMIMKKDEI